MNSNGLGELQSQLLGEIYERHIEYANLHFLNWFDGVDWHSPREATRSEQASQSRALARLEAYGLIIRVRGRGGRSRVRMRPLGIEFVEKWLTKKPGVWMLTVGTFEEPRPMSVEELRQEMARIKEEFKL